MASIVVVAALVTLGPAAAAAPPGFQPGTGPCTAVPEGLDLIIPTAAWVAMTNSTGLGLLDVPIAAGPNLAARGPDGTVWVETQPGRTFGVYRIAPGIPAGLAVDGDVSLSSVGWVGAVGRPR